MRCGNAGRGTAGPGIAAGLIGLMLASSPALAAPTEMAARLLAATLTVKVETAGEEPAVGSGFRVAPTGLVVSNAHVVGDKGAITVTTASGETCPARLVGLDSVRDLAAFVVEGCATAPLPVAAGLPEPGMEIWAAGAPLGLPGTLTRGVVSALDRPYDGRAPYGFIQHDAAINPGSSGGPLADGSGRVVGMNAAMPDGFRRHMGVAYAIPAPEVARFAADVAAGHPVGARHLKADMREVNGPLAQGLGRADNSGVLVDEVAPAGPANNAGIRSGDIVTAVAGRPTGTIPDLVRALAAEPIDKGLEITVERQGQVVVLTLAPEAPEHLARLPDVRQPVAHLRPGTPEALGFTVDGQARIDAVMKDTPAAVAGLEAGERIRAVGGVPVSVGERVARLVGEHRERPLVLLVEDAAGRLRHVVVTGAPADGRARAGNVMDRGVSGL